MSPDQFFKFSSEIFQKIIILQILNKNTGISISKSNVSKQLKNIHFPISQEEGILDSSIPERYNRVRIESRTQRRDLILDGSSADPRGAFETKGIV